jgi:hypothetical protein
MGQAIAIGTRQRGYVNAATGVSVKAAVGADITVSRAARSTLLVATVCRIAIAPAHRILPRVCPPAAHLAVAQVVGHIKRTTMPHDGPAICAHTVVMAVDTTKLRVSDTIRSTASKRAGCAIAISIQQRGHSKAIHTVCIKAVLSADVTVWCTARPTLLVTIEYRIVDTPARQPIFRMCLPMVHLAVA